MGERGHVKVFGMWASPIAIRVEWALKLKGVEYEYVDEDLANKSEDLLRHNPVTKKVPVLVHDGKPLAESLVILEYVDEAWKQGYYPIMPDNPYERARARFWAKYADDKVHACMKILKNFLRTVYVHYRRIFFKKKALRSSEVRCKEFLKKTLLCYSVVLCHF